MAKTVQIQKNPKLIKKINMINNERRNNPYTNGKKGKANQFHKPLFEKSKIEKRKLT